MPQPYKRLLANISKATSVAGFLQTTGPMALTYLREYAERSLDLRLRGNKDKLDNVAKELPALWPMLLDILNLEETNFMNVHLTTIVIRLLDIRLVWCLISSY